MSVLIIGSEGFIGTHLVDYFVQQNEEVIGADIKAVQKENYVQVNPYEPDYDSIFANHNFSLCINASGSANVKFSFAQPKIDFDSNTMTVFRLLNAIRVHQPTCKFINLSSAAVYGNSSNKALKEDNPCNPFSPYGYHKWYAELICKEYADLFKLNTCSARLFSVYGEHQEKLLFWDMWQKFLANPTKIELFGTGNEARDFLYVKDVAKALYTIYKKGSFDGTAINVASGVTTAIKDVATIFLTRLSNTVEYNFTQNAKQGDPDILAADTSKLSLLGFTSTYQLNEGLEKYIQWLKEKK